MAYKIVSVHASSRKEGKKERRKKEGPETKKIVVSGVYK